MSDHYCCKTCHLRYDECRCPDEPQKTVREPQKTLRERMGAAQKPAKLKTAKRATKFMTRGEVLYAEYCRLGSSWDKLADEIDFEYSDNVKRRYNITN